MNPEEQNEILDKLNFLHSDHDTFFEYNQEKLGSDIHASVSSIFSGNLLGVNTENCKD